MTPRVHAVSLDARHRFSKENALCIRLLAGLGVEGDAHCGATVRHRSRVAADPTRPNLRQVHLVHAELFDELASRGFRLEPGDIGENIATLGLDLLGLPQGTRLRIGTDAIVEVTGLRNPCVQLDRFQAGLMAAMVDRDPTGQPVFKAGIMAVVVATGDVHPGDPIAVELPPPPHRPLKRV
ncbi:MAG TPA: MOSC domain-containing protein [Microvirga sp.]|jgi:MOSC domain-containing protein YiiM|nr:MOSC domain-containing protein [Microvirga sp.]